MDDPKRFVPFVLEASGRFGTEAFLWSTYYSLSPILRFRVLVCVLSAKHNARMMALLPWVRFLRCVWYGVTTDSV